MFVCRKQPRSGPRASDRVCGWAVRPASRLNETAAATNNEALTTRIHEPSSDRKVRQFVRSETQTSGLARRDHHRIHLVITPQNRLQARIGTKHTAPSRLSTLFQRACRPPVASGGRRSGPPPSRRHALSFVAPPPGATPVAAHRKSRGTEKRRHLNITCTHTTTE